MIAFRTSPVGRWMRSSESATSHRTISINSAAKMLGMMLLLPANVLAQRTSVVTTIEMMAGPGREMVGIPCRLNGTHRRYICVIDSGATYTVISDRLVKSDGPVIDMTTGNGVVRARQREISLTIADGLELKSKALVQKKMLQGIDILLGQDVLRQFKYVTFDYENRKVEFQR